MSFELESSNQMSSASSGSLASAAGGSGAAVAGGEEVTETGRFQSVWLASIGFVFVKVFGATRSHQCQHRDY